MGNTFNPNARPVPAQTSGTGKAPAGGPTSGSGKEIKVNPEQMRAAINQMKLDIRSVETSAGQVKCEITKNTCKSVVDFGQKVTELGTKMTAYTGKFNQNLSALGRAINMVEEMDKALQFGINQVPTSSKR